MTMNDQDYIDAANNPLPPISIDGACAKYGIERKTLIGRLARNGIRDPLTVSGDASKPETIMIADDWRLWELKSDIAGDGRE